jgi:peptidoglycan L-alanyl-D-glutamate endopeptidase CwlK
MPSTSLNDCRPEFAALAYKWQAECRTAGLTVLIYCTLRTSAEQDELYKVGRTVKGKDVTTRRPMGRTVTNARGGQSAHNFGLALDFVPMLLGKPQWNDKSLYGRAIALAEKVGLQSLANEPRFSELAHLQQKNWRDIAGIGGTP